MKKDQYIPHEVSMRNTTEVMNLIEHEGMAGYGIYWALLEYLRTQDEYVGDLRVLKSLARQLKTSIDRLLRILKSYELFEVTDYAFRSRKLEMVMKPLDDKRKAMVKQSCDDRSTTVQRNSCNSLKTRDASVLSKVKESKEEKKKETSNKEKGDVAVPLAWERYVDELAKEQQWKEIMAMRSTLGRVFVDRFAEVLQHFKRHVLAVGSEDRIRSLSDAKHYFNNFNTPGSPTFVRLSAELMKPVDRGKFRYEEVDVATGQRSYCGVVIPPDAPPRPNEQAVWCEGEWVY